MMVGVNHQEVIVKGAFEYINSKAGLMPKRVEPRNKIRPFMV
jgi:hypothetical protein